MHLDGGAVGSLAHPGVEILSFPSFEKKHIVAVVELCGSIRKIEPSLRRILECKFRATMGHTG
jgi:hypothetical protein